MIEMSLSLIGRDVTKISPKIRLPWDMRRTVTILLLYVQIERAFPDKTTNNPD